MARNFNSFLGLAEHLALVVEEQERVIHRSLDQAARLLKKNAKAKVGTYQDEAFPFPAWAELADSTKEDRLRHGFTENDPGLRSGKMRDSIEHTVDDRNHLAAVGSDDDKLVYFELGTEKQPPRSVLGSAAIESTEDILRIIGKNAVTALIGEEVAGGGLLTQAPADIATQFDNDRA